MMQMTLIKMGTHSTMLMDLTPAGPKLSSALSFLDSGLMVMIRGIAMLTNISREGQFFFNAALTDMMFAPEMACT